ncbi:TraR/DksA C4-type zinc finger protein [Microbacterium sp. G2-8]|uniref:TraR/DksA family transcriptional regulator n=1 Tax=Microbacterium sp. G2-8 TaxID=2842454 RepID=UPI001C8A4ECB|nr:TraR/DksA C4-type zinc finger protein [Microbacterium sp. G2-8]
MTPAHRAELRALLEEHRESVLRARRRGGEDLNELADARSAATADDEHDPEGVTLAAEWSRLVGVDADARAELGAIDAALARVDDDAFGVCAACGRRIPMARLRVRPMATRCVGCAR